MFSTTAQIQNDFDKEINVQDAEYKRLVKFIQHIDLPKHDGSDALKVFAFILTSLLRTHLHKHHIF